MSDIEYLTDRCNKMSYLLGIAFGSLTQVIRDSSIANCQKEHVSDAIDALYKGIKELYNQESEVKE